MKKLLTLLTLSSLFVRLFSFAGDEAKDPQKVFVISELDKAPVPYMRIAPVYPKELKASRTRGEVVVLFVVDEAGAVESTSIESSSNSGFNSAAVEAVKQWKFKPGLYDEKAVKTQVRLPLEFELKPIEAYELEEVDVEPVPIKRVAPEYPKELKRNRVQAKVTVAFVVNEMGWVVDWEIESSSDQRFNESALAGIRQWKFKPGIKDGEPVKVRLKIPLAYTLRR